MNKNNNKKTVFGILALSLLFLGVLAVPYVYAGLNVDYPPIPTPTGLIDLDEEFDEGKITMSAIIIFVYSAALWIAGILAFLALIFAGFAYIVSGANPGQRARAMNRFKNVLWGFGIILVSSVILNIINPQIVTIKDPKALNINASDEQFLGFNYSSDTADSGGDTSNFSCVYINAPSGDTSHFSCRYASDGTCVPEDGHACEAGYAEDICSKYDGTTNGECNFVQGIECPADPSIESGCVPNGGDNCQAGYTEDFCSQYNNEPNAELLCNSIPQIECPAGT